MKLKYLLTSLVCLAAVAAQANTIVAGWDWSGNTVANYLDAGVIASQAWGGETNGVSVDLWTHEFSRPLYLFYCYDTIIVSSFL